MSAEAPGLGAGGRQHAENFYASMLGTTGAQRWAPAVVTSASSAAQTSSTLPRPASTGSLAGKAPAFRSSGLHVFGAYKAEVIAPPAAQHQASSRSASASASRVANASQPERPAGSRIRINNGISAENIGYKLLRKAGWREGTGLGVEEQGRTQPVEAFLPKGHRGIGFDGKKGAAMAQRQQQKKEQQEKRQAHQAQQAVAAERKAKIAGIIAAELAAEDVETKVKRYKQLDRQEAEAHRGRAIESYIRRAFNDPYDAATSADANPLGRQHRLAASNPLLDPYEFD